LDEAIVEYRKAISLNPEYARAHRSPRAGRPGRRRGPRPPTGR
jgi:hypothetical protein